MVPVVRAAAGRVETSVMIAVRLLRTRAYIPREGGPTFKYHFDVRIKVLKMGCEPPGLEAAYCASNAIGSGDRHRTRLGPIRPSREALLAGV